MKNMIFTDEYFMKQAYREAINAFNKGEVPVGVVVVANDTIIARSHNLTETLNDTTAHAEMQAITSAANYLGGKYLIDCTMYITLEPCVMCAGALFWSQISRIVYGASDLKRGYSLTGQNLLHPQTQITRGIMEKECSAILTDFFSIKRN